MWMGVCGCVWVCVCAALSMCLCVCVYETKVGEMVWTLVRENNDFRDFPGSSVVKIHTSTAATQIRSLVGELRTHKLHGMAKKKQKTTSQSRNNVFRVNCQT